MVAHINNGCCEKCKMIFDKFGPVTGGKLYEFFKEFQKQHPEAHISEASRNRDTQEAWFLRGVTRAHFGGSAHNWIEKENNCSLAIDLFELSGQTLEERKNIYDHSWFHNVVGPYIEQFPELQWFGETGSVFYELPHIQLRNWRDIVNKNPEKYKLAGE